MNWNPQPLAQRLGLRQSSGAFRSILSSPSYFLRWRKHAVKFHAGLGGRVFSLVDDAEATRFATISAAMVAADLHHLAWCEITVVCP